MQNQSENRKKEYIKQKHSFKKISKTDKALVNIRKTARKHTNKKWQSENNHEYRGQLKKRLLCQKILKHS